MREAALITVSCVLFIQMGLSEAVQETLHIRIRFLSCPKCLTWWICCAYLVTHDYGIIEAAAVSFVCSYAALWLALAHDALAKLYNNAYETITRDTTQDTEAGAGADEAGAEAGADEVSEMQQIDR